MPGAMAGVSSAGVVPKWGVCSRGPSSPSSSARGRSQGGTRRSWGRRVVAQSALDVGALPGPHEVVALGGALASVAHVHAAEALNMFATVADVPASGDLVAQVSPDLVPVTVPAMASQVDAGTVGAGAVQVAQAAAGAGADAVAEKDPSWFDNYVSALESLLGVFEKGFEGAGVPYAYGFAIIGLTAFVKLLTFPLQSKQVESTVAMQALQPEIKKLQKKYENDKERLQLETGRLYQRANVNPLAGCLPSLVSIPVFIGLYRALNKAASDGILTDGWFFLPSLGGPVTAENRGVEWLFPFVDGAPPVGWHDAGAYLILPIVLICTQFLSTSLLQPPQTDPSQAQSQAILKFLPFMVGYFSLCVPSGLTLYWVTNNVLSTGQTLYLRQKYKQEKTDNATRATAPMALRSQGGDEDGSGPGTSTPRRPVGIDIDPNYKPPSRERAPDTSAKGMLANESNGGALSGTEVKAEGLPTVVGGREGRATKGRRSRRRRRDAE